MTIQSEIKILIVNAKIGGIHFEFMSPGSTHHNEISEWLFSHIYSHMHVIMDHTGRHKTSISGYVLNAQQKRINLII